MCARICECVCAHTHPLLSECACERENERETRCYFAYFIQIETKTPETKGLHLLEVAALVPDIACCIFIIKKKSSPNDLMGFVRELNSSRG